MEQKSAEDFIQEDIKILTKRLKNLNADYDRRLEEFNSLPDQIEKQKRINAEIILSQEKTIFAAKKRIERLEKSEEDLNASIALREKKIKELYEKHAEISKRLLNELLAKQKEIDQLSKEISELTIRRDVAKKALEDLTDIRVKTDIEHDLLQGNIKEKREEFTKVNQELVILITKREEADEDLEKQREVILQNEDQKKELAIRLHDVQVLKLRLEPEFQDLLKTYLLNRG